MDGARVLLDRVLGRRAPLIRGNASAIGDRVFAASVETHPFPYLIAEGVLPPEILEQVRQRWPADEAFEPEVPGNYVCDPRMLPDDGTDRSAFWTSFARDVGGAWARAVLGQFAEWVIARYGEDFQDVMVGNFSLMRADPDYPGHPYRAHHWHDPLWIATSLIYIDEDPGGHQGTTLNAFVVPPNVDPLEYACAFASDHRAAGSWHGFTWDLSKPVIEVRTADYAANRMIAFLDSPISYHSVKPVGPGAYGARRLLRMHLGAPWWLVEAIYGVPYAEYRRRRAEQSPEAPVVEWLRRDISQVWDTDRTLSLAKRRRWARHLWFDF